jgi:hypothetical protein
LALTGILSTGRLALTHLKVHIAKTLYIQRIFPLVPV